MTVPDPNLPRPHVQHNWLDLLPIRDLGSLTESLAVRWREVASAERVVVSCLSCERTRLVVGWSGGTGDRSEEFDHPLPLPAWSDDAVRRCLDLGDARPVELRPPDGPPMAGVHVVGGGHVEDELLQTTERLIAQGRIVDRLDRESRAEKLEAMAEFAAGAGHEINNPLATINGRVQLLLKGETDPERRRSLEVIGGQAYRVRDMIGDAMLFARPPAPNPSEVDAAAVVRQVCETLAQDLPDPGPTLVVTADDPVGVFADPAQLAIVLTELVRNALHAAGENGTIRVTAAVAESTHLEPRYGLITVTDDGPGLTDLDRVHLFDPFYSGRQAGRGLGFGLSKAWRIIRGHGGRIDVDSDADRTTVRVHWPASTRS